MGDRTLNIDHHFTYFDKKNGFKAVVIFNPIIKEGGYFSSHTYAGKSDDFRGVIYMRNKHGDDPDIKYKKLADIGDIKK
jgi:hypothetical protein